MKYSPRQEPHSGSRFTKYHLEKVTKAQGHKRTIDTEQLRPPAPLIQCWRKIAGVFGRDLKSTISVEKPLRVKATANSEVGGRGDKNNLELRWGKDKQTRVHKYGPF